MSEETTQMFIDWGVAIVSAFVIFVVGKWIAKIITSLARNLMEKRNLDATLISFLSNILYGLLLAVVVITAIGRLGVDTTSAAAVMGAATLAIGFALQDSLGNFASGVMIIIFRPFKLGDFIQAGGVTGVVEDLKIFETHLKTPDNKVVIVPNGAITGGPITNFSAKDTRRVDLVFGVSYSDDLQKVKAVINEILEADSRILKDPAPTVGVLELADSSVNFAVRPWVNSADYWAVFFHLNETIKERFDKEGISIPFPQQDVHMHQVADTASAS